MKNKKITLKLLRVRYAGDSIGENVRIRIKTGNYDLFFNEQIKKGVSRVVDKEVGVFGMDKESFEIPIAITLLEQDPRFNDIGSGRATIPINVTKSFPQEVTRVIAVKEKRRTPSRKTAEFELTFQILQVGDRGVDYSKKNVTWWQQWKQMKQYKKGGVHEDEDYNRYDASIKKIVAQWNKEFFDDTFPPPEPLDPNLVKAILYQESRIGYDVRAKINVMQVGNPGDSSLKILRGELKEYWIHHGKLERLRYNARVTTVEESIMWGTRWLYHKAQSITRDKKRSWISWRDAVKKYGPNKDNDYVSSVWKIYHDGIKKEKKKTITLWSFMFMPLLIINFFHHTHSDSIPLADSVTSMMNQEERLSTEGVRAGYASDHSLFWAVIERETGWWEDLRIGRRVPGSIRWLTLDHPPTEQAIAHTQFITIKGFINPLLEVYGKTHAGNGNFYLYEINGDRAKQLFVTPALDTNPDFSANPDNFKKYGSFNCGEFFEGDMLESDYQDFNNDGFADVRLTGVADTLCNDVETESPETIVEKKVASRKVEKVFLWDESTQKFVEKKL